MLFGRNGILALTAASHMADLNPQWHELQFKIDTAMHSALEQLPLRDAKSEGTTAEAEHGALQERSAPPDD